MPVPSPCPPAGHGLRPRPRGLGRRPLREQALVGRARPRPLRAFGAPAGYSLLNDVPPTFCVIAPIPDLWPRFPPSTRRDDQTVCPSSLQSEKRTQRPKLGAIAKPPLRSGFAGPGSVLQRPRSAWRLRRPWRCHSGPLLRPAIRRDLTFAGERHLTTSRGPRDEVLRNSATPTGGSERRLLFGGG